MSYHKVGEIRYDVSKLRQLTEKINAVRKFAKNPTVILPVIKVEALWTPGWLRMDMINIMAVIAMQGLTYTKAEKWFLTSGKEFDTEKRASALISDEKLQHPTFGFRARPLELATPDEPLPCFESLCRSGQI